MQICTNHLHSKLRVNLALPQVKGWKVDLYKLCCKAAGTFFLHCYYFFKSLVLILLFIGCFWNPHFVGYLTLVQSILEKNPLHSRTAPDNFTPRVTGANPSRVMRWWFQEPIERVQKFVSIATIKTQELNTHGPKTFLNMNTWNTPYRWSSAGSELFREHAGISWMSFEFNRLLFYSTKKFPNLINLTVMFCVGL